MSFWYNYAGELMRFRTSSGSTTFLYGQGVSPLQISDNDKMTSVLQVNGRSHLYIEGFSKRFMHQDALGSVVAMTNNSHELMRTTLYDPFGKVISNAGSWDGLFEFVGAYGVRDLEASGKYTMGVRRYDASIGRFTSQDPLGFGAGDGNFYRYARNGPVNWIDPTGRYYTSAGGDVTLQNYLNNFFCQSFGLCDRVQIDLTHADACRFQFYGCLKHALGMFAAGDSVIQGVESFSLPQLISRVLSMLSAAHKAHTIYEIDKCYREWNDCNNKKDNCKK